MVKKVQISARRLRALEQAEKVAQGFRAFIGQRVVDQSQAQLDLMMDNLQSWMRLAGKKGYQEPPGWPKGTG